MEAQVRMLQSKVAEQTNEIEVLFILASVLCKW